MAFFRISQDSDKNIGFYSTLKGAMSYLQAGDNFLIHYGWMANKNMVAGSVRLPNSLGARLFSITDQNDRYLFSDYRLGSSKDQSHKSIIGVKKVVIKMNYVWTLGFMTGQFAVRPFAKGRNSEVSGAQRGSDVFNTQKAAPAQDRYVNIASGETPKQLALELSRYANELEKVLQEMAQAIETVSEVGFVSEDIVSKMPEPIRVWYEALEALSERYEKIEEIEDIMLLEDLEDKISSFTSKFEEVFNIPSGVSALGQHPSPNWISTHSELLTLYTHAKSVHDRVRDPEFAGQIKNMTATLQKLTSGATRIGTKTVSVKIIDFIREQQQAIPKYVDELSKLLSVSNANPDTSLTDRVGEFDFDLANVMAVPDGLRDMANKIKAAANKYGDGTMAHVINTFMSKYADPIDLKDGINSWEEADALAEQEPSEAEQQFFSMNAEINEHTERVYAMIRLIDSIEDDELESINDVILDIDKVMFAFKRFASQIHEAKTESLQERPQVAVANKDLVSDMVRIANVCDQKGMQELANEADIIIEEMAGGQYVAFSMDATMVRVAKMRDNNDDRCPFRLSIPKDCGRIGERIVDMYPDEQVEDKEELVELIRINQKIKKRFYRKKKFARCEFAESVMDDSTICNYGEINAGVKSVEFGPNTSGAYPMMWSGMFTLPLSWGFSGAESYMGRSPGTSTNSPFGMSPGYQGYLKPRLEKYAVKLYTSGLESLAEDLMVHAGR